MGFAGAERHPHPERFELGLRELDQLLEQGRPPQLGAHHGPFPDRHPLGGDLVEEGLQPVLLDLPVGEPRPATPCEPRSGGQPVAVAHEGQEPALVLGFDQQAPVVIGSHPVAAHLLHVDVVAQALHGADVRRVGGEGELAVHARMMLARPEPGHPTPQPTSIGGRGH